MPCWRRRTTFKSTLVQRLNWRFSGDFVRFCLLECCNDLSDYVTFLATKFSRSSVYTLPSQLVLKRQWYQTDWTAMALNLKNVSFTFSKTEKDNFKKIKREIGSSKKKKFLKAPSGQTFWHSCWQLGWNAGRLLLKDRIFPYQKMRDFSLKPTFNWILSGGNLDLLIPFN